MTVAVLAVGDRDKRGQDGDDCHAHYGTRTPKGKDGETIFVPRSALLMVMAGPGPSVSRDHSIA